MPSAMMRAAMAEREKCLTYIELRSKVEVSIPRHASNFSTLECKKSRKAISIQVIFINNSFTTIRIFIPILKSSVIVR